MVPERNLMAPELDDDPYEWLAREPASVDQGRLLKAQARLGHRDPATTLRHYSHATPLDDLDVADDLDALLDGLDQRYSVAQN
jgi:hypothetical protein